MGAPPRLKGLRVEDFKDAPPELQPFLQKFFGALNPFLNATSTALDRGLTFRDNHAAVYKQQTVRIPTLEWTLVGATGAPAFENSWYNYDTSVFFAAKYRIDDSGMVEHYGLVKHDTNVVGDSTIYTAPVGYRPTSQRIFTTSTNGDVFGQARVTTAGAVLWHVGAGTGPTWINLDGLRYPAATPAAPAPFVGPGWPIVLDHGLPVAPTVVQLLRAEDVAGTGNYSHCMGGIDWALDAKGRVLIRRVTGLTRERTYRLTFLVAA